jgi:hypothetical protein
MLAWKNSTWRLSDNERSNGKALGGVRYGDVPRHVQHGKVHYIHGLCMGQMRLHRMYKYQTQRESQCQATGTLQRCVVKGYRIEMTQEAEHREWRHVEFDSFESP